jgi:hypothetical protein
MQQLFALAEADGYRVFILRAREEVLDTTRERVLPSGAHARNLVRL